MALQTSYNTGTATINAGETVVTGVGTGWLSFGLQAGDLFWAAGLSVRVASVDSNTQITLAYAWPGATRTAAAYEVRVTPDTTRTLASARAVLDALTNGVLYALSGLVGAADRIAYFTGAGTAALATFTAFARSLLASTSASAARTVLGLANVAASGSASDLTTGTTPESVLPPRLQGSAQIVTDWQAVNAAGFYSGSSAANAPSEAGASATLLGYCVARAGLHFELTVVDFSSSDADSKTWRCIKSNGGSWSAWQRVRKTQTELNALYAQIAGPATDLGQNLGAPTRRYSGVYSAFLRGLTDVFGSADDSRIVINGGLVAGASVGGSGSIVLRGVNNFTNPGGVEMWTGGLMRLTVANSGIVSVSAGLKLPSYTVATLPAPSAYAQCAAYVSNGASSKRLAICDGTNWRFPDGAIVS